MTRLREGSSVLTCYDLHYYFCTIIFSSTSSGSTSISGAFAVPKKLSLCRVSVK
uniref:Uncharacterized protein n=1 Tax=Arundo donax TaxID=35708 RepID=A0A0A9GPP0_ARUDO